MSTLKTSEAGLIAGIAATSAMSIYSYALSQIQDEHYREPVILGQLMHRSTQLSKRDAAIAGWIAHYGVGLLFAEVYRQFWRNGKISFSIAGGLLLGGVSGLLAAAVWKSVLSLHPNPPKLKYNRFYGQLVPAHVLFGLVDFLVQRKCGKANQ